MMIEYRVVCDKDEHHNYNGKDYHYEASSPVVYPSYRLKRVYKDREQAEAALARAIKECPRFDSEHDNDRRDNIKVRQYNFRIQTREVTEWK